MRRNSWALSPLQVYNLSAHPGPLHRNTGKIWRWHSCLSQKWTPVMTDFNVALRPPVTVKFLTHLLSTSKIVHFTTLWMGCLPTNVIQLTKFKRKHQIVLHCTQSKNSYTKFMTLFMSLDTEQVHSFWFEKNLYTWYMILSWSHSLYSPGSEQFLITSILWGGSLFSALWCVAQISHPAPTLWITGSCNKTGPGSIHDVYNASHRFNHSLIGMDRSFTVNSTSFSLLGSVPRHGAIRLWPAGYSLASVQGGEREKKKNCIHLFFFLSTL